MFKETQEGGGRKEEKIKRSLEGTTQKATFLFTFSSPPCLAVSPCWSELRILRVLKSQRS